MACEHTFTGDMEALREFLTRHHPDGSVTWFVEPLERGSVLVTSSDGARFPVLFDSDVRWAPHSRPGGRFEVRGGMVKN